MANPEATNLNGYYFKDEAGRDLISQEASTRQTQFSTLNSQVQSLISSGLVPYAVDSTSQMVNQSRIYVLKSTGKWYYYDADNSAWTIGGDYQASTTLDVLYTTTKAQNPKQVVLSDLTWQNGGVHATNHRLNDTPNDRIRYKEMLKLRGGSKINFTGVASGFQMEVNLYSVFTKFNCSFISKPVTFTDNAETYTIPQDCWVMITIKSTAGDTIYEDDFATVAGYISTSELFLCDNEPIYGDITNELTYVTDEKFSIYGSTTTTPGTTSTAPVRINEGDYVGVMKNVTSDNKIHLMILNDKGEYIHEDNTPQPSNGIIAPANAKYVVFVFTSSEKASIMFHMKKKPVNYQSTLRILSDGTKVKLIAHSGLDGVAPEASIPAYTIAGEKGMWGCKLDINETADGHFIMSHDNTVDRMTDGTGNIIDMTLAQLQELTIDAGTNIDLYPNQHLVTFEQALEICKKYNMYALIDMKNISSIASIPNILSILESYGMVEQTLCQCSAGNRMWMSALRMLNENIPLINWTGSATSTSSLNTTIKHSALGWFNAIQILSSWNSDYTTTSYIDVIKGYGMPLGIAVADGDGALTKVNTAISNGAIYVVTDRVTPEDIAPNTYTA